MPASAGDGPLVFDFTALEAGVYCEYLPIDDGVGFTVTDIVGEAPCSGFGCSLASPEGLSVWTASLDIWIWDLDIYGVSGIEVDLVENDVAPNAKVAIKGYSSGTTYEDVARSTGQLTLSVSTDGEWIQGGTFTCCSCLVTAVRLIGDQISPVSPGSIGVLKARF